MEELSPATVERSVACKLFVEQYYQQTVKSSKERETRKKRLENQMEGMGLTEESKTKMRCAGFFAVNMVLLSLFIAEKRLPTRKQSTSVWNAIRSQSKWASSPTLFAIKLSWIFLCGQWVSFLRTFLLWKLSEEERLERFVEAYDTDFLASFFSVACLVDKDVYWSDKLEKMRKFSILREGCWSQLCFVRW